MEKANLRVVELFCLLHDTQRRNERRDPSHGRRAALYAQPYKNICLLTEAITYQPDGYTQANA